MSLTAPLTGELPAVLLAAAVLALPVSLLLLHLYRRAVQKGMRGVAGTVPAAERAVLRGAPSAPLRVHVIDAAAQSAARTGNDGAPPPLRLAMRGPWIAAAVYAVAGACYALIMTVGWLAATGIEFVATRFALLFWSYFWPAVLAATLIAAYDRRRRRQLLGTYFGVLLAISAIAGVRNPDMHVAAPALYWLITNGPATVLVLAFLYRPIRAVGPLVLTFLFAVTAGSQVFLSAAGASENLLALVADIGFGLGLGAVGVFIGMILFGLLAFALPGWALLRALGRRYQRKLLSDQSIKLDALWLLFALVQSIGLAFEGPLWMLTGALAFAGYKIACGFGFRKLGAPRAAATTLLLLRVFALGKRGETLFDKLRRHWLHTGSIFMIAGPDLVTSTVEPDEFLDFLSGRIGRQFVRGADDVRQRLADADRAPDPDGRYRVNEFFCHNDTWQMTMERLAERCDTVLMDLRSFSPANQGCVFELGRLLDRVDLERVVFLVDDTTDRAFLEAQLQRLWRVLDAASPNRSAREPTVRLFPIAAQSEEELRALLGLLTGGPRGEAPPAPGAAASGAFKRLLVSE